MFFLSHVPYQQQKIIVLPVLRHTLVCSYSYIDSYCLYVIYTVANDTVLQIKSLP